MATSFLFLCCVFTFMAICQGRPRIVNNDDEDVIGFDIHIIQNTTFPCNAHLTQPVVIDGKIFRKVELTDEEKNQLLEREGVKPPAMYMARSSREAKKNFPNLVAIKSFDGKRPKPADKENIALANSRLKDIIIDTLKKLEDEAFKKNETANHTNLRGEEQENKMSTAQDTVSNGSKNKRSITTLKGLKSTHENAIDEKEEQQQTYVDNDSTSNHLVSPLLLGLDPVVQSPDGSVTQLESCQPRKTLGPMATYYYMCTTCAATTTLPNSRWPPIINEALCSDTDYNCFITEGVAHGRCQQRNMAMKVLSKVEGSCTLALRDGETVIVDTWTTVMQDVRVGCECTIHKDSWFANFV